MICISQCRQPGGRVLVYQGHPPVDFYSRRIYPSQHLQYAHSLSSTQFFFTWLASNTVDHLSKIALFTYAFSSNAMYTLPSRSNFHHFCPSIWQPVGDSYRILCQHKLQRLALEQTCWVEHDVYGSNDVDSIQTRIFEECSNLVHQNCTRWKNDGRCVGK